MTWRLLSSIAGLGTQGGSLSVLYFHRVLSEHDAVLPDEPTAAWFERMLRWVQSQYILMPLDEAVTRMRSGSLPAAAAAITFDDGYRDNATVAAPLLQRLEVPATFFVSTKFLDGGIMWNDAVTEAVRRSPLERLSVPELGLNDSPIRSPIERSKTAGRILSAIKYLPNAQRAEAVQRFVRLCRSQLPSNLMMTSDQVRELARMGFGIGAHTHTHPILTQLPDAQATTEIVEGREHLEGIVGHRVRFFAYPNGRAERDYAPRHREMVKAAGFDAAFTTNAGVCRDTSDPWALPRFTPWDRSELGFRLRLIANQRGHSSS